VRLSLKAIKDWLSSGCFSPLTQKCNLRRNLSRKSVRQILIKKEKTQKCKKRKKPTFATLLVSALKNSSGQILETEILGRLYRRKLKKIKIKAKYTLKNFKLGRHFLKPYKPLFSKEWS